MCLKKKRKEKRKKKRKSTYAYESTKAIHVTIKVLYEYKYIIWKKKLCRRASYHMGTYEFKIFRHIRKPEFINVQSQIILLTEACIKYLD